MVKSTKAGSVDCTLVYILAVPNLAEDLADIIDNSDGILVGDFVQEVIEMLDLTCNQLDLYLPTSLDSEEAGLQGRFELSLGEGQRFSAEIIYDLVNNKPTFFDFIFEPEDFDNFVALLEIDVLKKSLIS